MKRGKAENLGTLSTIQGINVPPFVVLRLGMSEDEQTKVICNFLKKNCGTISSIGGWNLSILKYQSLYKK